MGFWELLTVALQPPLQVLLIAVVGGFLATDYCGIFPSDARRSLNKLVFYLFTPALIFGNLAQTITFKDIITWWFMPVNIGITFFFGTLLGWAVIKITKPDPHLKGLVTAVCSAGNLGNLMIVIVPAVCDESDGPFGNPITCRPLATSYASFSMAIGGFYIWTHTYNLIKNDRVILDRNTNSGEEDVMEEGSRSKRLANADSDTDFKGTTLLLTGGSEATTNIFIKISRAIVRLQLWKKMSELLSPATISAVIGLIVGSIPWLKSQIIGQKSSLVVIEDSISLLGQATIPCITLILGGNLLKGMRKSNLSGQPSVIVAVVMVKFIMLPIIGILVIKGASYLGVLPDDPLFKYTLLLQFAIPPAMNIGTITEFFKVGQEECSILFFWTYLVSAIALALWSIVFMWILTQ
ncbi:hypothetical protein ZOSMA_49G00280 [Zostera marina]|uniref:Auxin efflux carrier family protein n=1 Tax=Zostera marina TaxID=29655 RepID=A0A0K9NZ04_ZOSMR|nr:hypothetical protein ZOSMA_49G00280 [Zostera marina]